MQLNGPLLIAANHPNSFLDAIIIATLFKQPVYSLTRGDVFKNNFSRQMLRTLKMLPVYRLSEGAENLDHNYSTFDRCKQIFRQNGIVLIFSEGRCINEWHLRDLKKGTARLAISSWNEGIPLTVLPLGYNYQSFSSFGKNICLKFGNTIRQQDVDVNNGYGKTIISFNERLRSELEQLVVEIDPKDKSKIISTFVVEQPSWKKIVLTLPAWLGYLLHWPLYFPLKRFIWKKAAHTGHFDSIMVSALFLVYPVFLVVICAILFGIFQGPLVFLPLLVLPFCAWSYIQLKKQF